MAENIQTLSGAVIGVSANLPATIDIVGFEALTFTNIGLIETIPETGQTSELITFNELANEITLKAKGGRNSGGGDFVYALKAADGGQAIMEAAALSKDSYSIKFTYDDGSIEYVTGLVMSTKKSGGGSADIRKVTSNIEFDSVFIPVPAP